MFSLLSAGAGVVPGSIVRVTLEFRIPLVTPEL